jgi:hypothetical protein
MFNIVYRDGAPENTGHFEICKTDGSSVYKVGQAVYLDTTGAVKLCGGATNANKIYGIVAGEAGANDTSVSVLKVEKDMIFKCPITGANAAKAVKGMKLAINTTDYGSVVSAAASLGNDYKGATVVETHGAEVDGAFIEVRFEN